MEQMAYNCVRQLTSLSTVTNASSSTQGTVSLHSTNHNRLNFLDLLLLSCAALGAVPFTVVSHAWLEAW